MADVLGRDLSADVAARFAGRLASVTFTKWTAGTIDPTRPAGPTRGSATVYRADGIAFGYKERFVDGELIKKGDYRAVLLIGTIALDSDGTPSPTSLPNPGDGISIPPPGQSVAKPGTIIAIETITPAQVTCQVRGTGA